MLNTYKKHLYLSLLALAFLAFSTSTSATNFDRWELKAFMTHISEQTNTTVIIHPKLRGKTHITGDLPNDPDELLAVAESVLKLHGYALVKMSSNQYRVIRKNNIKNNPMSVTSEPNNESVSEYQTHIIQLAKIEAPSLVSIFRPLIERQGHLAAVKSTNALILVSTNGVALKIKNLLKQLGENNLNPRLDLDFVKLKHTTPSSVTDTLQKVFRPNTRKLRRRRKSKGTGLTVIPFEHLNAVILVGDPTRRYRAKQLINQLDMANNVSNSYRVVDLAYRNSENITPIINSLFRAKPQQRLSTRLNRRRRSNRFRLPKPPQSSLAAHNYDSQNAIILSGTPNQILEAEKTINQLDQPPIPIALEIEIIEVGVNGSDINSIQIIGGKKGKLVGAVESTLAGNGLSTLASAITDDSQSAEQLANGLNFAAANKGDSESYAAVLSTLLSESKVNVLSKPRVLGLSNHETTLFAGSNVPIVSGQATANNSNPFNSIERKDVGIELTVLPSATLNGKEVNLDIDIEASSLSFSGQTKGAVDIITNKRKIVTNVIVPFGKTIVLGGLISDSHQNTRSGVPIIQNTPLVGSLFQSESDLYEKRILMTFVTAEQVSEHTN